jgi:hypothetical protein
MELRDLRYFVVVAKELHQTHQTYAEERAFPTVDALAA